MEFALTLDERLQGNKKKREVKQRMRTTQVYSKRQDEKPNKMCTRQCHIPAECTNAVLSDLREYTIVNCSGPVRTAYWNQVQSEQRTWE